MTSIMIRDLIATETLDRQASLRVKGGSLPMHTFPHRGWLSNYYSYDYNKYTTQVQSASVSNAAAVFGGSASQNGTIFQNQSA